MELRRNKRHATLVAFTGICLLVIFGHKMLCRLGRLEFLQANRSVAQLQVSWIQDWDKSLKPQLLLPLENAVHTTWPIYIYSLLHDAGTPARIASTADSPDRYVPKRYTTEFILKR